MSEENVVITKAQIMSLWLGRNWFWVVLGLLIIGGMYVSATYLWNVFRGGEKEK